MLPLEQCIDLKITEIPNHNPPRFLVAIRLANGYEQSSDIVFDSAKLLSFLEQIIRSPRSNDQFKTVAVRYHQMLTGGHQQQHQAPHPPPRRQQAPPPQAQPPQAFQQPPTDQDLPPAPGQFAYIDEYDTHGSDSMKSAFMLHDQDEDDTADAMFASQFRPNFID